MSKHGAVRMQLQERLDQLLRRVGRSRRTLGRRMIVTGRNVPANWRTTRCWRDSTEMSLTEARHILRGAEANRERALRHLFPLWAAHQRRSDGGGSHCRHVRRLQDPIDWIEEYLFDEVEFPYDSKGRRVSHEDAPSSAARSVHSRDVIRRRPALTNAPSSTPPHATALSSPAPEPADGGSRRGRKIRIAYLNCLRVSRRPTRGRQTRAVHHDRERRGSYERAATLTDPMRRRRTRPRRAMPSLIRSAEALVKFRRIVFRPEPSAKNEAPGTKATLRASACCRMAAASIDSGNVAQTNKPPDGVVHLTPVGNHLVIPESIASRRDA